MILLVSTCRYRLSEEEFVRPIVEIVRDCGFSCEVVRYTDRIAFDEYSKVIICGTALRDFDYLGYIQNFEGLLEYEGAVLGICAGYQIIAKLFSNEPEDVERIGVYGFEVLARNPLIEGNSKAYFLHKKALRVLKSPLKPIAVQGDEVCAFEVKGRRFYGVAFHPEVLNVDIIANFLRNL